ncbi:MAG: PQQ-binding-like beta-propeller repeat protein [Planctomycetaceae bacterium]|nr:PQQ-binding-like beta-propeller repeat protein [Planctomycetaceae bacterium]
MKRPALPAAAAAIAVVIAVQLVAGGGLPVSAADWPQWRGPERTGISPETGLLLEWPEDGPPVDWQSEGVGAGYSAVVIADGRVMTQGDLDGVEHIIALDEKTGKLLWAVQPEPVRAALAEQLKTQFAKFDKDSSGQLEETEALAALGWSYTDVDTVDESADAAELASARTAAWLKEFDQDGNGRLDVTEFPNAALRNIQQFDLADSKAAEDLAASRARATIRLLDKDSDGQLSEKECSGTAVSRFFRTADKAAEGEKRGDQQLTADELTAYFSTREKGRDGEVTAEELQAYFSTRQAGKDGVLTRENLSSHLGGYRNDRGDGPRGTPTIAEGRVYVEGGNGDVSCLDARTGKTIWHVSLTRDLKGNRPGWGYSESPLVHQDMVFVTPGGKEGTVAALDRKTGQVIWRSSDVQQAAHYSSPVFAEIAGVPQVVQFARESVFGVSLDEGRLLWSYKGAANGTANCASPIVADNHVLASSGYGTGTGLVQVTAADAANQQAKEVYFEKKLANHHGGLVKVGDYVYGFSGGLICMNFLTGEIVWRSRSVSKGSLLAADGMLYCLGEGHEVALVEATPEEYREKGRFSIEKFGLPAWAHPAVANGRFYIRNQQRLTAYDVRPR